MAKFNFLRVLNSRFVLPVLAGLFSACDVFLPDAPSASDILNEPISELSSAELAAHLQGDGEFGRIFSEPAGLGPVFVSHSCESCHISDGKGHPLTTLTRFGRYTDGQWDPMVDFGGPQLQHRAVAGFTAESIPAGATGVARFLPPGVTGLGYLEAIPDSVLITLADPADVNGDGISGVVNWILPPGYWNPSSSKAVNNGRYVGRFGRKAGAIDLFQQVVTAYLQDMGITSDFEPVDISNPLDPRGSGDAVAEPEVSSSVVQQVVFYIRTLKVPPRRNEDHPDVVAGETLFAQIGCQGCHIPTLMSGSSNVPALDKKTIHPYTDLLLHDMGPDLDDGYTEGNALTSEWRTTPLWGLGLSRASQGGRYFLLHDGRARSIEEAIEFHGGEAAPSRTAFLGLTTEQRRQILRFLESL